MTPVPAAKIQFFPEDRIWIADRIQEVLASGQLTLGKYGKEFEEKFAASLRSAPCHSREQRDQRPGNHLAVSWH